MLTASKSYPHRSLILVGQFYPGNSSSEGFLGKDVRKTCSKFTGEHLCLSEILIKLHATLLKPHFVWVFSRTFAAYFWNTFS